MARPRSALVIASFAALLVTGTAAAKSPPLTIDPPAADRGATVTIRLVDNGWFANGTRIVFYLGRSWQFNGTIDTLMVRLGGCTANATGRCSVRVAVPDVSPGDYPLFVWTNGPGGLFPPESKLTVLAGRVTPPPTDTDAPPAPSAEPGATGAILLLGAIVAGLTLRRRGASPRA